jgi:hypothetical protein
MERNEVRLMKNLPCTTGIVLFFPQYPAFFSLLFPLRRIDRTEKSIARFLSITRHVHLRHHRRPPLGPAHHAPVLPGIQQPRSLGNTLDLFRCYFFSGSCRSAVDTARRTHLLGHSLGAFIRIGTALCFFTRGCCSGSRSSPTKERRSHNKKGRSRGSRCHRYIFLAHAPDPFSGHCPGILPHAHNVRYGSCASVKDQGNRSDS